MARYIWHGGAFVPADQFVRPPPRGPMIMRDLPAHRSPVDGTVISGRAHRREYMKRQGLREVEPSEWKPLRPVGEKKRAAARVKREQQG